MKVIAVFLTFVACALALPHHHDGTVHDNPEKEDRYKKYQEYSTACVAESGTTDEIAKNLKYGDFSVRDEKAQCYIKCFFKKVGLMSEEGVPQYEKLVEKLSKHKKSDVENVEELAKKCAAEKGENECETAFKVYECYRPYVSYGDEEKIKKIHEYSKQCVEETGTTDEVSKKLVNGDFSVRDEKAQCYVKCFFKKVGLMNEAGEPQYNVLLEKLQKKKVDVDNVEELAKKCIAEKGENECETAFKIYECYRGHVTFTHEFKNEEEKKPE